LAESEPSSPEPSESQKFCISCGYSLRGLPVNRCPECGQAFDPEDPRTYLRSQRVNFVTKWLARPPGPAMRRWAGPVGTKSVRIAFASLILAFVAHATLLPTPEFFWALCFLVWIFAAIMWMGHTLACAKVRVHYPELIESPRQLRRRFAKLSAITALIIPLVMVETPIPYFVHFWLHRPAFEALRIEMMESPLKGSRRQQARLADGLSVSRLAGCEDGFRFIVDSMTSPNNLDRGFVYWENGPPQKMTKRYDHYYRISPKWYGWSYSFGRDTYYKRHWWGWWPFAVAR
jgi:hypothetical protein